MTADPRGWFTRIMCWLGFICAPDVTGIGKSVCVQCRFCGKTRWYQEDGR